MTFTNLKIKDIRNYMYEIYAEELFKVTQGKMMLKILTSRDLTNFSTEERNLFLVLE